MIECNNADGAEKKNIGNQIEGAFSERVIGCISFLPLDRVS
jgi:hypothetical protein